MIQRPGGDIKKVKACSNVVYEPIISHYLGVSSYGDIASIGAYTSYGTVQNFERRLAKS